METISVEEDEMYCNTRGQQKKLKVWKNSGLGDFRLYMESNFPTFSK